MRRIGAHITMVEATKSGTATRLGIANTPSPDDLRNMELVATHIYDPAAKHFGKRPPVTSFFRSIDLNKAIGGAALSEHCYGRAVDMDTDGSGASYTNADLFNWIRENLEFDQLIWEFGTLSNPDWVHCGYREGANRKQVLVAYRKDGRTSYRQYGA